MRMKENISSRYKKSIVIDNTIAFIYIVSIIVAINIYNKPLSQTTNLVLQFMMYFFLILIVFPDFLFKRSIGKRICGLHVRYIQINSEVRFITLIKRRIYEIIYCTSNKIDFIEKSILIEKKSLSFIAEYSGEKSTNE